MCRTESGAVRNTVVREHAAPLDDEDAYAPPPARTFSLDSLVVVSKPRKGRRK